MEQASNPFQPPAADISPPQTEVGEGALLSTPRRVTPGRGVDWLRLSYRLFMKRKGLLFLVAVLVFVPVIVLASVFQAIFAPTPIGVDLLVSLVGVWLSQCLVAGMMVIAGRADRDLETSISDLFSVFSHGAFTLLKTSLGYLLLLTGLQILFGALLIPLGGHPLMALSEQAMMDAFDSMGLGGIFLALILFYLTMFVAVIPVWLAPVLVAHHRLSALEVMRLSSLACLRNIPTLLLFGVLVIGLSILATIPLLLGWLLLLPMVLVVQYIVYRDVLTDNPPEQAV